MTVVATSEEMAFLERICGECVFHVSADPANMSANGVCKKGTPGLVALPVAVPTKIVGQPNITWIVQAHARATGNSFPACSEFKIHPALVERKEGETAQ